MSKSVARRLALQLTPEEQAEFLAQTFNRDVLLDAADRCPRNHYTMYVSGACLGDPGPGGWGVYMEETNELISGPLRQETNDSAELEAIIRALQHLPDWAKATVYTSSCNCIGWLRDGWDRIDPKIDILVLAAMGQIVMGNLDIDLVLVSQSENEVANKLAADAAASLKREHDG